MILGMDDPDVEFVGIPGVPLQRVLSDKRANDLLLVGVNENARLHRRIPSTK
jgi:hypothetical protein